jgi:alkylation response protein AidB-like acyl-CoA dehydrogenase
MTDTPELSIDEYRALLDEVFDDSVVGWTAEAEASERFPRKLIEHLGERGVFAHKWRNGQHPDVPKLVALAFALGKLGSAGIGVGVSLHDSAIAILRRFGRSDYLKNICEQAVRGEAVLCIGASEESGGSDLQIVQTEVRSVRDGFEVRGVKKYVSLSPVADHIMVVARGVDHDENSRHGNVLVIAVPTSQTDVQLPYRKVGAGPLDTAAVHIDTWVPADALIARPGTGLAAISWGLAHERISIAGQVAAGCQRALGITHARMVDRRPAHRRPAGPRRPTSTRAQRNRRRRAARPAGGGRREGHRRAPWRGGAVGMHAYFRRRRLSGGRDADRSMVARHEAGPDRRRHRRGAVGTGGRGDEARSRRLQRTDRRHAPITAR